MPFTPQARAARRRQKPIEDDLIIQYLDAFTSWLQGGTEFQAEVRELTLADVLSAHGVTPSGKQHPRRGSAELMKLLHL